MRATIPTLFCAVLPYGSFAALCGTACDLYTLKWDQEFSSSTVDTSVWNYRTDRKALSAQLPANVQQSGDELIINLKKEQSGTFSYTGGGLISKAHFQYGYYESRIKMNNGQGWHSSFWLMAGNGSTTEDTATHTYSEIDIIERDSTTNSKLAHNINLWNADGSRHDSYGSGQLSTSYDFTDWHVFGALWRETDVTFYIDGTLSSNLSLAPSRWTHDYLNVWMTSIAYQVTPDDSKLPSKMESSYVKYYQKDYYLTASSLCFANTQGSTPCQSNSGYTESGSSWMPSTLDGYTKGLVSRYSCNVAGATASWSLPSATAGTYEVWAWIIVQSNSDAAVSYAVVKGTTTVKTVVVDQTAGASRWVLLASGQAVSSGQTWSVRITASGRTCARADTVKFVRTS